MKFVDWFVSRQWNLKKNSLVNVLNFVIRQSLLGVVNIPRIVGARDVIEIKLSVTFPLYTYFQPKNPVSFKLICMC
jgi:hypothetical protein